MAGGSPVPTSEEKGGKSVDTRPPDFTMDDLLAQLRPEDCGDQGLSYEEICIKWGWVPTSANVGKVRTRLNDPLVLGTWTYVGKKEVWNAIKRQKVWVKGFRPVAS